MAAKFPKNTTAKEFFKAQCIEALDHKAALTIEERYQQVKFAQRVRNFWFTATSPPFSATGDYGPRIAATPRLSEPVVITDILSMFDYTDSTSFGVPGLEPPGRILLQVMEYGGKSGAYGEAFWGLSAPTFQEFLVKHEKTNSQTALSTIADIQGKLLNFVPRLLEPYQALQVTFDPNTALDLQLLAQPQLGFRAVRALPLDDTYAYLKQRADVSVNNYVKGSNPVTFLMELQIPFAQLPTLGKTAVFKTEQNDRPLLVLGACSNIEGAQGGLYDEAQYYNFTLIDQPLNYPNKTPFYTDVPLSLWAPNTDFRTANLFNIWPVAHFLEPGAQLRVTLTSGLIAQFDPAGGFFTQSLATRSSQAARITFLCRTP